jgi:hypothetical protein
MLEALWSTREIIQYIAFSCGVPGLVVATTRYVSGIIHPADTLPIPICGCAALVITLVIGVRHAFPLKELLNLNKILPQPLHGVLPARGLVQARHLPFLCLSSEALLAFIFPSWFPEWPLAVLAYISAWVYIRYLMHFPYANLRGDHSSEFNFSLLFPKWSRPTIEKIAGILYSILTRLSRLLELRPSDKSTVTANVSLYSPADSAAANAVMEAIGTEKAKFEERRAKALKFLDENIAALIGRKEPVDDSLQLIQNPTKIEGLTSEEIAEV